MSPASPVLGIAIQSATTIALQVLGIYFELMRATGRSQEEIDSFYQSESVKFYANNPGTLPDAEGE